MSKTVEQVTIERLFCECGAERASVSVSVERGWLGKVISVERVTQCWGCGDETHSTMWF